MKKSSCTLLIILLCCSASSYAMDSEELWNPEYLASEMKQLLTDPQDRALYTNLDGRKTPDRQALTNAGNEIFAKLRWGKSSQKMPQFKKNITELANHNATTQEVAKFLEKLASYDDFETFDNDLLGGALNRKKVSH